MSHRGLRASRLPDDSESSTYSSFFSNVKHVEDDDDDDYWSDDVVESAVTQNGPSDTIIIPIKKFNVTWSDNIKTHQWSRYNKSGQCINVNGRTGPLIRLTEGHKYLFHVNQPISDDPNKKHSLIFTTKPDGGIGSARLKNVIDDSNKDNSMIKGVIPVEITSKTPELFFYHCAYHEYEGGQCHVNRVKQ